MFKVILIFVIVVIVILTLCPREMTPQKTIRGGAIAKVELKEIDDVRDYSTKHERSIQDDIKKVVAKKI